MKYSSLGHKELDTVIKVYIKCYGGTSLEGQWLRLLLPIQGYWFDPWLEREDPTCLVARKPEHKQQKQYCNKFNKDLKNDPHQKKKRHYGAELLLGKFRAGFTEEVTSELGCGE